MCVVLRYECTVDLLIGYTSNVTELDNLVDWLIDWFVLSIKINSKLWIDWLIEWLNWSFPCDRLIDWLIDWQTFFIWSFYWEKNVFRLFEVEGFTLGFKRNGKVNASIEESALIRVWNTTQDCVGLCRAVLETHSRSVVPIPQHQAFRIEFSLTSVLPG